MTSFECYVESARVVAYVWIALCLVVPSVVDVHPRAGSCHAFAACGLVTASAEVVLGVAVTGSTHKTGFIVAVPFHSAGRLADP